MKKIILTLFIAFTLLISGFLIYISSGSYDISQLTPHNGLTKWIIKKTTHSTVEKRMTENIIPDNYKDTSMLILGFKHYDEMCTGCHGAPGVKQWEMAEGLYPKPPKLYQKKKQEDPQEFFWIIKNGIKMTSMPAYSPTQDDQIIWAMTAFATEKLNKMTEEEYKEWMMKYAGMDDDADANGDDE